MPSSYDERQNGTGVGFLEFYLGSYLESGRLVVTQNHSTFWRTILPSKGVIHYMREVVLLVSLPVSGGRYFGVHNLMVIGCAFLVTIRH